MTLTYEVNNHYFTNSFVIFFCFFEGIQYKADNSICF